MTHLFLQLDPELGRRARKLAAQQEVSLNDVIELALRDYLEAQERERRQSKVQLSQSYYGESMMVSKAATAASPHTKPGAKSSAKPGAATGQADSDPFDFFGE